MSSSEPTLLVIVDGWPRESMRAAMTEGKLPGFSRLAGEGHHFKDILTPVPSVSIASHASIATGVMPREHRIPAHRWRGDNRRYRNYIGMDILRLNRDLACSATTVFEAHSGPTYAAQTWVSRGADKVRRFPTMSSSVILGSCVKFLEGESDGLAVAWLPKGDAIGHRLGPDAAEFQAEMVVVDRELTNAMQRLDNLRVVVIADHGQKAIDGHVDPRTTISSLPGLASAKLNWRWARHSDWLFATSGDSAAGIYVPANAPTSLLRDIQDLYVDDVTVDASVLSACRSDGTEVHRFQRGADRHFEVEWDPRNSGEDLSLPPWVRSYLHSFVPGRSADLLLVASDDNDFAARRRLGFGFGHHVGSHGGIGDKEMLVDAITLGVNYERQPLSISDVTSPLITPVRRQAAIAV